MELKTVPVSFFFYTKNMANNLLIWKKYMLKYCFILKRLQEFWRHAEKPIFTEEHAP